MDYTTSGNFATAPNGQRLHTNATVPTTRFTPKDANGPAWELLEVIKEAGLTPAAFDPLVPSTYTQVLEATRRLSGFRAAATNAALRATAGTTAYAVATLCRATAGDGGQGEWSWDAASVATDDDLLVVMPTGQVGAGRWVRYNLNRADMAAPAGSRLIGYEAKAANAVIKTAQEKMRERVSVLDFCANGVDGVAVDPTGVLDSTLGLQAARNYVAANPTRVKLVFPSGIYKYSVSPNWAINNACIEAEGEVRLRYTGTGDAVILDAGGAVGDLIYNTKMGGFLVEAPSTASEALFVRSVHHSDLRFNLRGCGTTSAALLVKFAVCTDFRITVSVNEGGWYNSGSGQAKPAIGINLDIRNPGEFVSYCTFNSPIIEGPPIGIQLTGTLGNTFNGGTAEACATYGVFATTGANSDKFIGMDFEANGLADVYNNGDDVSFIDCDSTNVITFGSSCRRGVIRGGLHNDVLFDAGSIGCIAAHFYVNRLLDDLGTFVDAGSNSSVVSVRDCSPALNTYLTGTFAFTGVVGIPAGGTTTATVTVRGCKTTDVVMANLVGETALFTHSARVSSAETVVVTFKNETGGTANLSAGTIKVVALRP